jgi:hypothetical protein
MHLYLVLNVKLEYIYKIDLKSLVKRFKILYNYNFIIDLSLIGLISTTKEEIKLTIEGFIRTIKNKSHFSIETYYKY